MLLCFTSISDENLCMFQANAFVPSTTFQHVFTRYCCHQKHKKLFEQKPPCFGTKKLMKLTQMQHKVHLQARFSIHICNVSLYDSSQLTRAYFQLGSICLHLEIVAHISSWTLTVFIERLQYTLKETNHALSIHCMQLINLHGFNIS